MSKEAIKDLRTALQTSYGEDFDVEMTDEEINEVGELLLNILAEGLKLKISVLGSELLIGAVSNSELRN